MRSGVTTVLDNAAKFLAAVDALVGTRVMIGVPAEKTNREDGSMTNAALAYVHTHGAPEINLPARPFLEPGIRRAWDQTVEMLKRAGELAFTGGAAAVDRQLHRVGLVNQAAARAVITEGIPPPLAPRTVAARINRLKGAKRRGRLRAELAAGAAASRQLGAEGLFTPLVVSGQLRNAITYVLRKIGAKLGGLK